MSVNAVASPTVTDLFFNGKTPKQIAHMSKMAPLERLGCPEDIVGVAWWPGRSLLPSGCIDGFRSAISSQRAIRVVGFRPAHEFGTAAFSMTIPQHTGPH